MSRRLPMSALCLLTALALTGCQKYNPDLLRQETFTINSPYAVMDSPRLAALKAENPPPANDEAWWYARHDERLGVGRHVDPAEVVYYEIELHDRQHSHSGHIHNSVRREVRTIRAGQYVR